MKSSGFSWGYVGNLGCGVRVTEEIIAAIVIRLAAIHVGDKSTVLQPRTFSERPIVGIVDSSQNQTRPARILARPGTRSAGAVCRAAE
jgi:hypothetical protein